jgi:16S rRNA (uracil1498-N3)-methyltransferase
MSEEVIMPRFFVNAKQINDNTVTFIGNDAHHISRSLRMAAGERVTVCDGEGTEYQCELTEFLPDCVRATVLSSEPSRTEPPFKATVYQALPKGEKLDSIIQKSVECGASEIALFESERCIVRIKDGEKDKKGERRQRIALEAAKQCGRGVIPTVSTPTSYRQMLACAKEADLALFCYEGEGTESLAEVVKRYRETHGDGCCPTVSVVVGSEGGFSEAEAAEAKESGMHLVGLGPRILRTETAAAFVLGCLVYELEL